MHPVIFFFNSEMLLNIGFPVLDEINVAFLNFAKPY